jgi:hypothetical protein
MINKNTLFAAAAALAVFTPNAFARYSEACFTPDEVRTMIAKRDVVSKGAADCLKNYWSTHQAFFQKNGYSKYFGVRNRTLDTVDKRARALLFILAPNALPRALNQQFEALYYQTAKVEADGKQEPPGLTDIENYFKRANPAVYAAIEQAKVDKQLIQRAQEERGKERGGADLRGDTDPLEQNISCVDLSRRCLQEGMKQAGMIDTFEKIDHVVLKHDVSGTEIQKGLSDLGWKTLFFDPDPSQNAAWDEEDKCIAPLPAPVPGKKPAVWVGSWGGHAEVYNSVMKKGIYPLGGEVPLPIDDKRLLVGYRTSVPAQFSKVPYFIGTAHGGYHVFPGFFGNVIEGHSVRALGSIDNMQVSVFNPTGQAYAGKPECAAPDTQGQPELKGGPRWTDSEHYRTGVIVVPPGYLDDASALQNPPVDDQGCVDLKPRH